MLISVIIPVFNEEENLYPLYDSLRRVLEADRDNEYEVIFIDDCSTDSSFSILKELSRREAGFSVRIIKLARNAGTHIGLLIGARYCRGDAAVFIAADLQCPIEVIPRLAARHSEQFPIVWGVREKREDPLLTRIFARLYYGLLKLLLGQKLSFLNIETFLIDRKVVEQLKSIREKNTNILLLISGLGFNQCSITLARRQRHRGRSGWTLSRKIKLLVDSLVSFSYLPIRFISYLGIVISLAGFFLAGVQIYEKLIGVQKPLGWAFLAVIVLILFGIQMLMLGVLGEYLWRALDQISSKPLFVVDTLVGFDRSDKENFNSKKPAEKDLA